MKIAWASPQGESTASTRQTNRLGRPDTHRDAKPQGAGVGIEAKAGWLAFRLKARGRQGVEAFFSIRVPDFRGGGNFSSGKRIRPAGSYLTRQVFPLTLEKPCEEEAGEADLFVRFLLTNAAPALRAELQSRQCSERMVQANPKFGTDGKPAERGERLRRSFSTRSHTQAFV